MSELEQLKAAIDSKMATNLEIRYILKLISSGKASLDDSAKYSQILSHILGQELASDVLELSDREDTTSELLHGAYDDVNDVYSQVQTVLDKKAGIAINPKRAPFPAERVQQFAHSLADPTVEDSVIKRRARAGSETITKSFHDDCIEANAKFRDNAGLKCYIIRKGSECCEWCTSVEGKYRIGDQPEDIFRRHDNCDCTIIYDGQVLRGQTGAEAKRGKKWVEVPEGAVAETAMNFTNEQARKLDIKKTSEFKKRLSNDEITAKIDEKSQSYKPIILDKNNKAVIQREYKITAYKAKTTQNDIYISENVNIKPKKLHDIDGNITKAINKMEVTDKSNLPSFLVVSRKDMATNDVAVYRAIENQLIICEDLATYKPSKMPKVMEQLACSENDLSSYIHELYHWSDAETFRNEYGSITDDNYDNYIDHINRKSKISLDKLSSKGYNVIVSKYASDCYEFKQYYEVYTEWRVEKLLKGVIR